MSEVLESRDAWLSSRNLGIGGSEIAAILGLDPYKSPYSVWLEKTTGEKQEVNNAYTRSGIKLEKVVVEYFEEETGYKVQYQSDDHHEHKIHPEYSYMRATKDRTYFTPDGEACILECKTTQKEVDTENLPMSWYCQLQWYMGLYQMKKGALAWLERGIRFNYQEIDFDEVFFQYLFTSVKHFWETYVITNVEPPMKDSDDVLLKFPNHADGKKLEATEELFSEYQKLQYVRGQIAELEEKEKAIIEQFKVIMRDAEICAYGDTTLATWKSGKPKMDFDAKAFMKENPKMYEKYVVEKPSIRRFLIK